jgi:hypothetical protein
MPIFQGVYECPEISSTGKGKYADKTLWSIKRKNNQENISRKKSDVFSIYLFPDVALFSPDVSPDIIESLF